MPIGYDCVSQLKGDGPHSSREQPSAVGRAGPGLCRLRTQKKVSTEVFLGSCFGHPFPCNKHPYPQTHGLSGESTC